MHRALPLGIALLLLAALTACASPATPSAPVEITRLIEITVPVEVTRQVQITVPVAVTRQVIITATPSRSTPVPVPPARDLKPEAVIAAIQAAGLECAEVHELAPAEYKLAPYVGRGLRFMLPSHGPDYGGRVFYVAAPTERAELRAFYEEMGRASAILASYLYERDNILLQIPGDVPLEIARQYQAALQAAIP